MRTAFVVIYIVLICVLGICTVIARRSTKPISKQVSILLAALIPPVIGNMIIIWTGDRVIATLGMYVYFLGMDVVLAALLVFAFSYCKLSVKNRVLEYAVLILLGVDMIQLLCNVFFGHSFSTEPVLVEGYYYYSLVPHVGQSFHRLLDYGIFISVLLIFLSTMIRASRVDVERYAVILVTMVLTGLSQTFFIFSRTPIDRSMMLYGVFGLLVFYFSLYHRPLRLLDRMLASIASEIPDGLFFFDVSGQCIWANRPGVELADLQEGKYDEVPKKLTEVFGEFDQEEEEWTVQRAVGTEDSVKSYVVEKHLVSDDRGKQAGFFLRIRDNTDEQRLLQHEIFKATHDSLTGVYNRAGYDLLLSSMELATAYMLLIDVDRFKDVNDTYGHDIGDKVLQRIAETIRHSFRESDYVCRIGGDEFVVFVVNANSRLRGLISDKVERINRELGDTAGGLPSVSVSVGVAFGGNAEDAAELYRCADLALYETKRNGRNGFTFYREDLSEYIS